MLFLCAMGVTASAGPSAWAVATAELETLSDLDARADWVDARLQAGEQGLAEAACRDWVEADPSDANRWVLLARVFTDDPALAELLLNKALDLAPEHRRAQLDLGRVLQRLGQHRAVATWAEDALAVDVGSGEAWLLLATSRRLLGDPDGASDAATTATERLPEDPGGWLLLAELHPDRSETWLTQGLEHAPGHPDLLAALTEAHLRAGEVEPAAAALQTLQEVAPRSADAARLAPLADCMRTGTLDAAGFSTLQRNRRAGLLGDPSVHESDDALVARLPDCGGVWVGRAARRAQRGDLQGALQDLGQAVVRMPADPGASAAYGLALLEAGKPEEALSWLEVASARRPWDVAVALAEAHAAIELGDAGRARTVLLRAWEEGAQQPQLAVALAEALEDRGASFDLLLAAVARAPSDDRLVEAALDVGASLDRQDEVRQLLLERQRLSEVQDAPPPRVGDDGIEEIVVLGERESDRLRKAVEGRLQRLGYGEGRERRDRTVFGPTPDHPAVTLRHDGRIEIQRSGFLAPKHLPSVGVGTSANSTGGTVGASSTGTLPRLLSRRLMGPRRWEVLETIGPDVAAWRDALAQEGTEEALQERIPTQIDALWNDGVPLSGEGHMDAPADRRRALLDYWASRTCSPAGDAVRTWVETYLALEVQASDWPVTAEELAAANAACPCGTLTLPEP